MNLIKFIEIISLIGIGFVLLYSIYSGNKTSMLVVGLLALFNGVGMLIMKKYDISKSENG
ncbi:MAG: hypothetical protein ACP5EK_03145 [Thermoplasmatota archaeon]